MSPSHDSNNNWHTLRPCSSRLSLVVREITSVSATFVLMIESTPGDDPEDTDSDLLGRELAVKVNREAWEKILVDVVEEGEEAIIVLYGLMPGQHYEIEINVISGKTESVRKHVVTTTTSAAEIESNETSPVVEQPPELPGAMVQHHPHLNPSSSSSSLPLPSAPPPPPPTTIRTITIDERAAQLRHTLSLLNSEKDALLSSLKSARKESQRADAALRSEMDTLKRAFEKQSAGEQRMRQKALALQEAVKQARAAAVEADERATQVQDSIPALDDQAVLLEKEHAQMEEETRVSLANDSETISTDKRRMTDLANELSSITHRVERLTSKKEKLENETLPDLETDLRILQAERMQLEREEVVGPIRRPTFPTDMNGSSSSPGQRRAGILELPHRQNSVPSSPPASQRTRPVRLRKSSEVLAL